MTDVPMIGNLTLSDIQQRLNDGQSPQGVARDAGLSRLTLLSKLRQLGLETVHRWDLVAIAPNTPSEEVLNIIGKA